MAKGTKHGFIPEEGTVIQATVRPEDLIPALTEELFLYRPCVTRGIKDEYGDIYRKLARGDDLELHSCTELFALSVYYLVDTLFERLNEEGECYGFYFGANPGDGSDFGFWRVEEEV